VHRVFLIARPWTSRFIIQVSHFAALPVFIQHHAEMDAIKRVSALLLGSPPNSCVQVILAFGVIVLPSFALSRTSSPDGRAAVSMPETIPYVANTLQAVLDMGAFLDRVR
jgi:hypothetical protein